MGPMTQLFLEDILHITIGIRHVGATVVPKWSRKQGDPMHTEEYRHKLPRVEIVRAD